MLQKLLTEVQLKLTFCTVREGLKINLCPMSALRKLAALRPVSMPADIQCIEDATCFCEIV